MFYAVFAHHKNMQLLLKQIINLEIIQLVLWKTSKLDKSYFLGKIPKWCGGVMFERKFPTTQRKI